MIGEAEQENANLDQSVVDLPRPNRNFHTFLFRKLGNSANEAIRKAPLVACAEVNTTFELEAAESATR